MFRRDCQLREGEGWSVPAEGQRTGVRVVGLLALGPLSSGPLSLPLPSPSCECRCECAGMLDRLGTAPGWGCRPRRCAMCVCRRRCEPSQLEYLTEARLVAAAGALCLHVTSRRLRVALARS